MSNNREKKKKEDDYKHLSFSWYKSQSDKDRMIFESVFLLLVTVTFLLFYTISLENNESGYYKIHSALFYCNMIVLLLFIIRRKDLMQIIKNTNKLIFNTKDVEINELTDVQFLILGVVFIVSILFVVDVSFMSNYGLRIGAVAAFGLFTILRSVIYSFRSSK